MAAALVAIVTTVKLWQWVACMRTCVTDLHCAHSIPSSDVMLYPGFEVLSSCSPIVITSVDSASKISYLFDERIVSFPEV